MTSTLTTALEYSEIGTKGSPYEFLEQKAIDFYKKHLPRHTFMRADDLLSGRVYEDYRENLQFECLQGRVLRGYLHASRFSAYEGTVFANGREIVVSGRRNMNRALDGDIVYLEMYSDGDVGVGNTCHQSPALDEDGGALCGKPDRQRANVHRRSSGRVVGIHRRRQGMVVGMIKEQPSAAESAREVIVVPMSKRFPEMIVSMESSTDLARMWIALTVVGWGADSKRPHCQYLRCLGRAGDMDSEIRSVLFSLGIYHDSAYFRPSMFGEGASMMSGHGETGACGKESANKAQYAAEVEQIVSKRGNVEPFSVSDFFPESENKVLSTAFRKHFELLLVSGDRLDLQDICVFSIDPPMCTDIDDAIHIRKLSEGYEVGIHIADVSHFVEKGSLVDGEALRRGNSTYLRDRRIEMLPSFLSGDLCSLRSGSMRLAMSVIVEIGADMELRGARVARTAIRSRFSFTYEQAQRILEKSGARRDGRDLYRCARCRSVDSACQKNPELSGSRHNAETMLACTCICPEYEASMDEQKREVADALQELFRISTVLRKKRFANGAIDLSVSGVLDTNHLVEEYMLLANTSVARMLLNSGRPSLLRVHPEISDEKMGNLHELNIDISTFKGGGQYGRTIEKVILTRNLSQATYRCSDSIRDRRHHGLAVLEYTHFTSPIRRYADLVVHRLLGEMIKEGHATLVLDKKETRCAVAENAGQDNPGESGHSELFDYEIKGYRQDWYDRDELDRICSLINKTYRSAKIASRETDRLFTYRDFREGVYDAFVIGTSSDWVQIYIDDLGVDEYIFTEGAYHVMDKLRVALKRNDEAFFVERRFCVSIVC